MNQFNRTAYGARTLDTSVDAGLRSFMLGVYNKMGLGLVISAALAWIVGTVTPVTALVLGTPLIYVVQFGPIALLFGSMFFMRNPSPMGAAVLYWSVVTLIGMGMGVWVMIAANAATATTLTGDISLTFGTIAQAFVITAASFFALSIYGYTTKTNLQPLRAFLFMGIIGVLLISIINIFFIESSGLQWIIQFAILGLMAGVTAWQTQNLKLSYAEIAGNERSMAVMTYYGALNLYIAFVNMFQVILMLLGNRD
ncbi:Bax inhibitor-1/YccA family protein [Alkalicaulis satelles]|uniref:Bax inhibitor-1/YccA family protein n=1 Tax=Alkalicaulis satelles TaxID=2609175 RepID=A0A5M6ZCG5_9PROT|nr:Bax inhibitor-1/YccA family protein [Alkalicaulis satelles]KAA5802422.1 Bax inhibitor-1/YccA family protein [Alkalicaulis satelles]